jgi:hypothetical protein
MTIDNACYLLYHVGAFASLDRISSNGPKEPSVWRTEKLTLAKELCVLQTKNASCRQANQEIIVTCMWTYGDNAFFQPGWKTSADAPSKQFETKQVEGSQHNQNRLSISLSSARCGRVITSRGFSSTAFCAEEIAGELRAHARRAMPLFTSK